MRFAFISNITGAAASSLRNEPLLWGALLLAFFLRVAGIHYGLPLWLVADEPPFTLGALQMLQLKTLLPALHPDAFNTLYYPPYLSYLYLLPFAAITAFKLFFWHGAAALFPSYLLSDLSPFFMTARFISVLLGVAGVYVMYRVSESLFKSRAAALAAAFLLATSITHIGLSMVARHWMPTSLAFLLVLYILTRENMAERRRYIAAVLIAGIGMGFDTTAVLALFPIFFWWLYFGSMRFAEFISDRFMWLGAAAFLALAALPTLLHPGGNGFLNNVTVVESKHLIDFLMAPLQVIGFVQYSEPVLAGLAAAGLLLLLVERRKLVYWMLLWMLAYLAVFLIFFRLEPRFFLPFIPLYALLGGYAVSRALSYKALAVAAILFLLVPLIGAARLSALAVRDDTRAHARAYVLQVLPQDKVLVYALLTRLPTRADAVKELRGIDPAAVRKTDMADEALDRADVPYALNLYNVRQWQFFDALPDYAREHGYGFLLYAPADGEAAGIANDMRKLTDMSSGYVTFAGLRGFSIADSVFTGNFFGLFANGSLGEDIVLYRITP